MKNYIQPGKVITVAAPADVLSGAGVMIANIFGVAAFDALSGIAVEISTEGVFEMPKLTANAFTVGQLVNWNNSTKEFQTATSTLDACAVVVEAASGSVSVAKVKLVQV